MPSRSLTLSAPKTGSGAHAGLPQRDRLLDVRAREHRGAFGLERQADRRGAVP
jgi:hypothetical protein